MHIYKKMRDHVSLQDSQVRCVNVVPTSQADQHEADHSPTPNAQVMPLPLVVYGKSPVNLVKINMELSFNSFMIFRFWHTNRSHLSPFWDDM